MVRDVVTAHPPILAAHRSSTADADRRGTPAHPRRSFGVKPP